jgi:hypothetical protein
MLAARISGNDKLQQKMAAMNGSVWWALHGVHSTPLDGSAAYF